MALMAYISVVIPIVSTRLSSVMRHLRKGCTATASRRFMLDSFGDIPLGAFLPLQSIHVRRLTSSIVYHAC